MEQSDAPRGDGRVEWLVTWGRPMRWDWRTERVRAFDAEDAEAEARRRHPELPAPTGVFRAR